ncbi:MAG: TonB-dependent receptor plug domain-containing protein, partial [Mycobacteriales bacterium]
MPRHGRIALIAACLAVSAASWAADPAPNAQALQFDIKPQPLASALNDFAVQSHQQILFTPEITKGKTTGGARGALTPDAALKQLLAGTGLSATISAGGDMILVSQADGKGASATRDPQVAPNGAANLQSQSNRSTSAPAPIPVLEEVVVTAQKRAERLQDVPVPVTALSADNLAANNQVRLQDYYASVPGLGLASSSKGDALLTIRGITTGVTSGNPTVGITIDDVPYGSSSNYGGGGLGIPAPDLDPSDLARVEVLRGPQGTLYGASSIGGLLKFVTADPAFDGVSGRIQGGGSTVHNAPDAGYVLRGSVNVPLNDEFAVRASAFTRRDPGYVDNEPLGPRG